MKFWMHAFCAIAAVMFSGTNVLAEDEGFESIFNGKDLSGWKAPAENKWWTVKDGILIGENDEKKAGNIIETEKQYSDVVIESEVKWSGEIDSGIFLRKSKSWQCQIGVSRSLKKDMTCSIYVPKGGYVVKADPEKIDKLIKKDDWNKFRIEAKGDHFKIWLNGESVIDTDLAGYNEPGPVGLQIHPGLPMKVEFKSIKVKALDAKK
jgi:hypothetical protein